MIILAGLAFITLLVIAIVYPLLKKRWSDRRVQLHSEAATLTSLQIPVYSRIAVALDFSANDQKLIEYALGQGRQQASFVLLHVVESVSARIYEHESDDLETEKDKEHLLFYARQLSEQGFHAEARIGFGERAKQLVQLVNEYKADMLVIGAHGHGGFRDLIYGETINTVRHELKIPVLVVNL